MQTNTSLKVAIITGGAKGIGWGIAQRFHKENYQIIILDRDKTILEACEKQLKDKTRYEFYNCDVSDEQQVKSVFDKIITTYRQIDALVNNAGVAVFKEAADVSFKEWKYVMDTNLDGPFLCSQAAFPAMLKTKGSIVNIASISGVRASTLRIAYGTSKAALMHLTKQMAVEYGNQGVRVNAVAPGPVETDMAKMVHSADIRTSYHDAIPMARYGTISEIANSVYFLCSPQASFINGQILAVDGGYDAAGVGLPSLRE
jgi:meso-butanediol dehydrogenase / (S,S)-butanediol dehydrogenase / diacetyl reductase